MSKALNQLHAVVAAGENFEALFKLKPSNDETGAHEVGVLGGTKRFGVTVTLGWPTPGGGSAGTSEGHGRGGIKKALKALKSEYAGWIFDEKSLKVKSRKCELPTKDLKTLALEVFAAAFPKPS